MQRQGIPGGTVAIAAVVLLTWSVGLFGCGKSKAREALTGKLEQSVRSASETGGTFHMAELTDFDWDTFHVFMPYIGEELMLKKLGMDWSGAREVYDTECLLVFVKEIGRASCRERVL